jgi:glucosylceramidase
LRAECYDVYGNYFVKYLKEYESRGSPVYAITIQNEPLYAPSYPGMLMSANEQINFIQYSLGPKLRQNGLNTKIVIYDHNYDDVGVAFVNTVLNDFNANQYIAGVGFHPYTTNINHAAMSNVHSRYNKEVWLTEAGSGTWIGTN